jgi:hypothetical protein
MLAGVSPSRFVVLEADPLGELALRIIARRLQTVGLDRAVPEQRVLARAAHEPLGASRRGHEDARVLRRERRVAVSGSYDAPPADGVEHGGRIRTGRARRELHGRHRIAIGDGRDRRVEADRFARLREVLEERAEREGELAIGRVHRRQAARGITEQSDPIGALAPHAPRLAVVCARRERGVTERAHERVVGGTWVICCGAGESRQIRALHTAAGDGRARGQRQRTEARERGATVERRAD